MSSIITNTASSDASGDLPIVQNSTFEPCHCVNLDVKFSPTKSPQQWRGLIRMYRLLKIRLEHL